MIRDEEAVATDTWLQEHREAYLQFPNGKALYDALVEKIEAVDARTRRTSGPEHCFGYGSDPIFIRRAARYVLSALEEGALGDAVFCQELTMASGLEPKPQMILEFISADGGAKVLKTHGRERPYEGPLRQELAAAGIAVVPVGSYSTSSRGGWIVMDRLPGVSLQLEWMYSLPSSRELVDMTRKVAAVTAGIHRHTPSVEVTHTIVDDLSVHVDIAIERLPSIEIDLRELFEQTSTQHPWTLLHGDVSPGNVMRHHDSISLIDVNSYLGPPAIEVANWVMWAGVTNNATAEVLGAWLSVETDLDPNVLLACLAIEALTHAGLYRLGNMSGSSVLIDKLLALGKHCYAVRHKRLQLADVPALIS